MKPDSLARVLDGIETQDLEAMGVAALAIFDSYRVLSKSETSIVAEILRGADDFLQWEHYPEDDVIDYGSQSQYFYHAHAPEDRGDTWDEHGHFHTFLRGKGIPEGVNPAPVPAYSKPEAESQANCHLVAISMNQGGQPVRLFTVNRWVTGDTWYAAEDVIGLLPRFDIDLALPSWPVNVWITGMMRLFRPQIEGLLRERDRTVAAWAAGNSGKDPYEAREIEILSEVPVSVEQQALAVDSALKRRGHDGFVT